MFCCREAREKKVWVMGYVMSKNIITTLEMLELENIRLSDDVSSNCATANLIVLIGQWCDGHVWYLPRG